MHAGDMNRRRIVAALVAIGAAPLASAASPREGAGGTPANAASGTLANGRWTPTRNPDGTITDASWAQLPLNQVVEWAGTALESQLKPPYGAEGTFRDWGVEGISAHFDDWAGAAFDEATGRFFCFGGGHAGSSNNMLSCFDCRTGKWSVAIPPTPVERMPPTYARTGLAAYTQVGYPDGRAADNFVPTWTPPGDGRPCAMHTYGGLIFVKIGANEYVVRLRGGTGQTDEPGSRYWLANLSTKQWEKGGAMARSAGGVEQHATFWNGLLYWGMEGGQTGDNQYWTITKYDPAQRKEVGTFGIRTRRNVHFGNNFSSVIAPGKWLIGISNPVGNGMVVLDLASGVTEVERPWTGEMVAASGSSLASAYVPEIGRPVLFDQAAARWLEFDPATGESVVSRIQGKPPACVNGVYGRLRYWPQRKALILHSRTMQNARVIRFG